MVAVRHRSAASTYPSIVDELLRIAHSTAQNVWYLILSLLSFFHVFVSPAFFHAFPPWERGGRRPVYRSVPVDALLKGPLSSQRFSDSEFLFISVYFYFLLLS